MAWSIGKNFQILPQDVNRTTIFRYSQKSLAYTHHINTRPNLWLSCGPNKASLHVDNSLLQWEIPYFFFSKNLQKFNKNMNNQQLWQSVLGNMEVSLSRGNFTTWFKNTSVVERGDNTLIIGVPSEFIRKWIAEKFQQDILKVLSDCTRDKRNQIPSRAKPLGDSNPSSHASQNFTNQHCGLPRISP